MPQDTAHSDSDWGSSGTDESSLDSKKVEIVIDWPKNTDVRPASLHPLRKNAIIGKFLEIKRTKSYLQ